MRSTLQVEEGRVVLSDGLDQDVLAAWLDSGDQPTAHSVEVPPGRYAVGVYTYLHSMNGVVLYKQRAQEWGEAIGAWFRRDHPESPFPSWLGAWLTEEPELDPGHEMDWAGWLKAVREGRLHLDLGRLSWVGSLVHLTRVQKAPEIDRPDARGWYPPGTGLRRPSRSPVGVTGTIGDEDSAVRRALAAILPERPKSPALARRVDGVAILERVKGHALTSIDGGPVDVSLTRLSRLFRLAWFATDSAHPEVALQGGGVAGLASRFAEVPGLAVSGEGDQLRLGFPASDARFGTLEVFEKIPAELWGLIPVETRVELATVDPNAEEPEDSGTVQPSGLSAVAPHAGPGTMRFAGSVVSDGDDRRVRLTAATPGVTAARLREALSLVEASENGEALALTSPSEAAEAFGRFMREWGALVEKAPPILAGSVIRLAEPSKARACLLAAEVFRMRYAGQWPHV